MRRALVITTGLVAAGLALLGEPTALADDAPAPAPASRPSAPDAKVVETRGDGGLLEASIDLDGDGRVEIKNYWKERADAPRLLVRKEFDLNHDGKYDVVSYFDDGGQLEKEEIDSDLDGTFDLVDHYQGGDRVMSEFDSDQDGRPNVFRYFTRGADGVLRLERKERDENGDGRIDVWERYDASGAVVRMGRDVDGDGKVDVRE